MKEFLLSISYYLMTSLELQFTQGITYNKNTNTEILEYLVIMCQLLFLLILE